MKPRTRAATTAESAPRTSWRVKKKPQRPGTVAGANPSGFSAGLSVGSRKKAAVEVKCGTAAHVAAHARTTRAAVQAALPPPPILPSPMPPHRRRPCTRRHRPPPPMPAPSMPPCRRRTAVAHVHARTAHAATHAALPPPPMPPPPMPPCRRLPRRCPRRPCRHTGGWTYWGK